MTQTSIFLKKGATFSACKEYRYALWRKWDVNRGNVLFIGLNPSTADDTFDDNTIIRCTRFVQDWGYGGFFMANLFAYIATDPLDMKNAEDPVGPNNDYYLKKFHAETAITVAAWGGDGKYLSRCKEVTKILQPIKELHCLGITKDGLPRHPLYLKRSATPAIFQPVN